jgi:hypothetical protein
MIEIGRTTEHEMIAAFLQAEVQSSRFQHHFPVSLDTYHPRGRELIEAPNFNDAAENAARRTLLEYRGYPDRHLFAGFPANSAWHRVRLEPQDFVHMRYAGWPEWVALSGGSRLVTDGACNYAAGVPVAAAVKEVGAIAAAIGAGATFAPLIAAQDADGSLILIEGHKRATAYSMTGATNNVECLVARAPTFKGWRVY